MDSPHGSHTFQLSAEWMVFGEKIPRLFRSIIHVCGARHHLCGSASLTRSNREYWMVVLNSLVDYIMPSPHMFKNEVQGKPQ